MNTEYHKIKSLYKRDMEGLVGVPARRIYDVLGGRVIVKIKGCDFD